MKVDEARRLAKEKIEELAQALERGESETLKAYLAAMARFPRYSVNNMLLILAQRPGAQRCAGLRTWNTLGRVVRRGERAIAILAPCVRRRRPSNERETSEPTTPDPQAAESDDVISGFRGACVFDVSQTEGAPLPAPACVDGDPSMHFDRLVQTITDHGVQLTYSQAIGPAHGVSTRDRIVLRPDLAPAERFSTAVHELAHILLGHHAPTDAAATATQHETEAESVAYVVCQAIGLDTNTAASDYVQYWGGNAKTLAASLERIQRTAAAIITAIQPDTQRNWPPRTTKPRRQQER